MEKAWHEQRKIIGRIKKINQRKEVLEHDKKINIKGINKKANQSDYNTHRQNDKGKKVRLEKIKFRT
jgi:hypothetical protein